MIPLERLLNKRRIRELLAAFAEKDSPALLLALADADGQWLAAYPALPARAEPVTSVCRTRQIAADGEGIAVPLFVGEDLCGILYGTLAAAPYIAGLGRAIEMLIEAALSNKSLARETLERYREINLFYQVHETIGSLLDLEQVVHRMLQESIRIIKAEGGSVLLADELTGRLVLQDGVGLDVAEAEQRLLDQAFSLKVSMTGKSQILNDIHKYIRLDDPHSTQLVSLLSAPLKTNKGILGVITLGHTQPGAVFTAGDQKLLSALALQASVALENARQVEARERRLKQQIEALRIEIDEQKKQHEVHAITETEYFNQLRESARRMRAEFNV